MPKWLQGMVAPTLALWFHCTAMGIALSVSPNGELPGRAENAGRMAWSLILAWWVVADARKRRRALCHDYDAFIFFAWPVVMPVYLFQTRGLRALLTLLCFTGIWLVTALVASLLFLR